MAPYLEIYLVGHLKETVCHDFLYGVHYHCLGLGCKGENGNAQNYTAVNVKNSQFHELPIIKIVLNHHNHYIMLSTILCEANI